MSDRALRTTGLVALVLLAAEVLFLGSLLPIDQGVWLRVVLARGCATDDAVGRIVQLAVIAMMILAVSAVLLHVRRRGFAATWPYLALLAIGAFASEVLKETLSRARPSNLPGVVVGHGFPSSHVMNVTLTALVVLGLAASFRRLRLWRISAVILVAVVAAGRVLVGGHWVLDVIGALLAAVALAGLALPALRRRPLMAPAVLAGILAVIVGARAFVPGLHAQLPSPLATGDGFLDVDIGAVATAAMLSGDWSGGGHENPAGSLAWVRGAGAVTVFDPTVVERAMRIQEGLKPDSTDDADTGPGELLVMAARPETSPPKCLQVRLAVNGNIVASFVPFRGWREYRIPLPDGTYRTGYNEVQIAVRGMTDQSPQRLAVSRFRLRLR